jgi:nucleoside-diphosphate-sugar epimerase
MRVFLTGATGYIGGAVAAALRDRGHDVAALVRADSEAKDLRERGVVMVAGDLRSLPSLADSLTSYDAFINIAQSNNEAAELNQIALDVFSAQSGFFVYTSGVWVCGNTGDAEMAESDEPQPIAIAAWRPPQERAVIERGGAVLRPGCVYGGSQSLLRDWFVAATENARVRIVGDGRNHWAMVNLHDLADCYVRIVEQRAGGLFHGTDDTHESLADCARAVAPHSPIETTSVEAAREHLGPFADALAIDQRISSKATREKLGWTPSRTFTSSIDEQWREWRASVR